MRSYQITKSEDSALESTLGISQPKLKSQVKERALTRHHLSVLAKTAHFARNPEAEAKVRVLGCVSSLQAVHYARNQTVPSALTRLWVAHRMSI